jgi:superfamily II DNA/RNA helicase
MIKNFLSRFRTRPKSEPAPPTERKAEAAAPPKEEREARAPRQDSGRGPSPAAATPSGPPTGDAPGRRRRRPRRKPAAAQGAPRGETRREASGAENRSDASRHEASGGNTRAEEPREQARAPRERSPRRAPVEAVTGPQPRDVKFGNVDVSAPVARALADMGYDEPTPIQSEVILPMFEGRDVVGQAQTGTGKTAGFGIPIAEFVDGAEHGVQAIVLVPTRELAQQVTGELVRIFRYRGISAIAVYGGAPIARQITALDAGAQVVVGTPGRVIDLLDRGILRIGQVRTVILDEADMMLDIGFLPDIRKILRQTPRDRQTAMFTATVPTSIKRLIYSYLREPQFIRIGEESEPVDSIRQMYVEVARRDKLSALREVFETIDEGEQTLVFRRTQEDVDWLVRMLKRNGVAAEAIHGGLRQSERNTVMQDFRDGKVKLLVSTNLTSRGIDVPAVAHVINYDIPEQVEEYVHRIGRTARMGRPGTAVTFVSEWDQEFFDAIRDHVGADKLEEIQLEIYSRT